MKLKAKASLWAGVIALAMPFAASANFSTVNLDADSAPFIVNFSGLSVNTTAFGSLGDQGGVQSSFRNLTVSGISNVYFKVATGITSFAGTAAGAGNESIASARLVDTISGDHWDLTATGGQYNFIGLKAGDVYDWQVGFQQSAGSTAKFNLQTGVTVNAPPVPEPEEWAMMLVGAGLVSYQVRRKQKGLSQSTLA
jgi:hypothetical protein